MVVPDEELHTSPVQHSGLELHAVPLGVQAGTAQVWLFGSQPNPLQQSESAPHAPPVFPQARQVLVR
jgi:hypothetical protein